MTHLIKFPCYNCAFIDSFEPTASEKNLTKSTLCNRCDQAIYSGKPLTLNDANFKDVIENSDSLIIVDFWSIACGPCKAMLPAYAKASELLFPKIFLTTVNIETSPQTTEKYEVRGLPTFIGFYKGQSFTRKTGALTTEQIIDWAESLLKSNS